MWLRRIDPKEWEESILHAVEKIGRLEVSLNECIEELESSANVMRGMWLDRTIPVHARAVLKAKAEAIDELTERLLGTERKEP